jgi:threonine dehydrogenase-like Zn-dependent dehydrogenase
VITRTATMAAAVVAGARNAELVRTAIPKPQPDEALVRIEGCGVCASNVPVWEGRPWFEYPLPAGAPGHEGWGVVEAVGANVDDVAPGDRVALLSYRAFAEYDVAPAGSCVPIPDGAPAPLEPIACAVNVLRRSDVRAGKRVAVVGPGFLGRLVAALAERAGADVVAFHRDDAPHGAFERVVECAGNQAALDTASALVADGGRLVIAGYHQDGPRTVDMQSWNWRGIDVVNAHERDERVVVTAMADAAALLAEGAFDVDALLTHKFPLRRLGDALEAARTRPRAFVKAWVEP